MMNQPEVPNCTYDINDYYLKDPILAKRHAEAHPPMEAYLYFPEGLELIEFNPQKPHKTLRRIFEGVEFNKYENEKFRELQKEIAKYNLKNPNNQLKFPNYWKESETRRFLQATSFSLEKTIDLLQRQFQWRKEYFPIVITDNVIKLLNSGFIYIHGRDNHFRPILVCQAHIYVDNKDKYRYEDWLLTIVYFMEYLVHYLIIPGQVENWSIISDVSGVSMVFPPADLKKVINILQANYRCRLYVNYIIGMNAGLRILASIIMKFVDPATVRKIRFLEKETMNEILTYLNEENVEEKFGGKATNTIPGDNNIFPPIMPSANLFKKGDDPNKILISEEKYKQLCMNKKPIVISPKHMEKWENEERETKERDEKARLELDRREHEQRTREETEKKREHEILEERWKLMIIPEGENQEDSYVIHSENVRGNKRKIVNSIRKCMDINYYLPGKMHLSSASPDILNLDRKVELKSQNSHNSSSCEIAKQKTTSIKFNQKIVN